VHADASLRERERDPAGADPELERRAAAGELDEEVDDRLDGGRGEQLGGVLVVPRCNPLAEVVLAQRAQSFSSGA
jgi:hypothetical protein